MGNNNGNIYHGKPGIIKNEKKCKRCLINPRIVTPIKTVKAKAKVTITPPLDYTTLLKKNEEAYSMVFTVHYPDEERPAGRPIKKAPCYGQMLERGAVFGSVFGWERPNWFAPEGYFLPESELAKPDTILYENYAPSSGADKVKEKWSFRRSNYFEFVGAECLHVHNKVGLLDMSAFSKNMVEGPGAEDWLESLFANRLPRSIGRIGLCHLLTAKGGVRSEFTVYRLAVDRFYLVSAGMYDRHDFDYLSKALPTDGSVQVRNITEDHGVLVVAGPNSRGLLQKLTDTDFSNQAFPWLSGQNILIGGIETKAIRVNFVGELGWELHHPINQMESLYDAIYEVGQKEKIINFGTYAVNSLRMEKAYRGWGSELTGEISLVEAGMDRFFNLKKKNNFIGAKALEEKIQSGVDIKIVYLEVDVDDVDARGNEPVYHNNKVVGVVTSGGYGFRTKKSLAFAYVKSDLVEASNLEIEIQGKKRKAKILHKVVYDPENKKLTA